MTRAAELLADAETLARAIEAEHEAAADGRQSSSEALELIGLEIGKLRLLVSGRSPLPEWSVYLSVSSLNKGLIEIGGGWRKDARLVAMADELTQKAYRYFKDVRPPI